MLAVSPLSTTTTTANNGCRDIHSDMDSLPCFSIGADVDFPEFDTIDFDDLFAGDSLPYLEIDPSDLLADFSVCPSTSAGEEDSGVSVDYTANQIVPDCYNGGNCTNSDGESKSEKDEFNKVSSIKEDAIHNKKSSNSPLKPIRQGHKSSKSNNNSNNEGKRKTKVDWTPDLHRRFVQAVEQLGVDKAVPSRILELMGIDCLTRHNVASHLQKYRSHRKHLLAREAEAANWTQKRQIYGMAVAPPPPPPNGGSNKKNANHVWPGPPTMGFPPPAPPPIHRPFRPLHVWGHPTHHHVEHPSPMPIWPKQLIPPPPHAWAAPLPAHHPPPPVDPSLWHSRHQRVPNAVTPLTPCFPHPLPATRFAMAQPVPGIPPTHTAIYKPDQHRIAPPPPGPPQSVVANPDTLDSHPTKESIDAAIEDVLSKPWLPLPIGLKPPATDSVMGELQRQGIPAIPPSCA